MKNLSLNLLGALLPVVFALSCDCGSVSRTETNKPPKVQITHPSDGAVLGGAGPFALKGQAQDAEDGVLTGADLRWSSSMDGELGTGQEIETALTTGVHLIKLTALDSGKLRASQTITVTISDEDQSPQATIERPQDGASLVAGSAVELRGSGIDPEEGPLADALLAWSSSIDGALGTGAVQSAALSQGNHTITLVATDSAGNTGSDSVAVTVTTSQNQAPTAIIDAPNQGDIFTEGETIQMVGHASDPEDGELLGNALIWSSSSGALGNGPQVSLLNASIGEHQIVLTAIDSQGLSGLATVGITVLPLGSNRPPVVSITSPTALSVYEQGESIDFAGSAADFEDGPLSGEDLVWSSDIDGELHSGDSFSSTTLSLGSHGITLTASDSQGLTGQQQVAIVVNPQGSSTPVVAISQPLDGAIFSAGDTLTFAGSATDAQDGVLTGQALTWRSSLDGVLGTGSPLVSDALSVGLHTITLSAVNAAGAVGLAQVEISLLEANTAPTVTIEAPSSGSSYTAGSEIRFEGSALDTQDGALGGESLRWSSNLDGQFGSGSPLDFSSLTQGDHTVTLTAIDSFGLTGTDSISLTVEPSSVNLPPVARLTGPAQGFVGEPVAFDGSGSSDPDGSLVDYHFDFGDGSSSDGAATAVNHIFAAVQTFTVVLTVTDNEGATDTAQLQIELVEPVRLPQIVGDLDEHLGQFCDIGVSTNGATHVVFRSMDHPGLWYGVLDNGQWSIELVDAMGFDIGARIGGFARLVLSSSNQPHIAYLYANGQVRYAHRGTDGWILERINETHALLGDKVAIALDAADRPTVVWTTGGVDEVPALAWRDNGTWLEEATPLGASGEDRYSTGGLVLDDQGGAWFTWVDDSNLEVMVSHRDIGGTYAAPTQAYTYGAIDDNNQILIDNLGQLIVVHPRGVEHRVGSTWQHSDFEIGSTAYLDATDNGGLLWAAINHGGDLEVISAVSGDYWEREYLGTMDPTEIGISVLANGEPAVCFFRSGNLMVY